MKIYGCFSERSKRRGKGGKGSEQKFKRVGSALPRLIFLFPFLSRSKRSESQQSLDHRQTMIKHPRKVSKVKANMRRSSFSTTSNLDGSCSIPPPSSVDLCETKEERVSSARATRKKRWRGMLTYFDWMKTFILFEEKRGSQQQRRGRDEKRKERENELSPLLRIRSGRFPYRVDVFVSDRVRRPSRKRKRSATKGGKRQPMGKNTKRSRTHPVRSAARISSSFQLSRSTPE